MFTNQITQYEKTGGVVFLCLRFDACGYSFQVLYWMFSGFHLSLGVVVPSGYPMQTHAIGMMFSGR